MQLCLYSVVILLGGSGCGKGGGIAQAAETHRHQEQQGSCFHHVFVDFYFWFCFGGHLQKTAVLVLFLSFNTKEEVVAWYSDQTQLCVRPQIKVLLWLIKL